MRLSSSLRSTITLSDPACLRNGCLLGRIRSTHLFHIGIDNVQLEYIAGWFNLAWLGFSRTVRYSHGFVSTTNWTSLTLHLEGSGSEKAHAKTSITAIETSLHWISGSVTRQGFRQTKVLQRIFSTDAGCACRLDFRPKPNHGHEPPFSLHTLSSARSPVRRKRQNQPKNNSISMASFLSTISLFGRFAAGRWVDTAIDCE